MTNSKPKTNKVAAAASLEVKYLHTNIHYGPNHLSKQCIMNSVDYCVLLRTIIVTSRQTFDNLTNVWLNLP